MADSRHQTFNLMCRQKLRKKQTNDTSTLFLARQPRPADGSRSRQGFEPGRQSRAGRASRFPSPSRRCPVKVGRQSRLRSTFRLTTRKKDNKTILLRTSPVGTPGRLWGWALQEASGVGHFRVSLRLGTPGRLCGPVSGGRFSQSLGLGTPGSLWGTPGSFRGWALQGVSRSRPGEEKRLGRGEELSLKSNNI